LLVRFLPKRVDDEELVISIDLVEIRLAGVSVCEGKKVVGCLRDEKRFPLEVLTVRTFPSLAIRPKDQLAAELLIRLWRLRELREQTQPEFYLLAVGEPLSNPIIHLDTEVLDHLPLAVKSSIALILATELLVRGSCVNLVDQLCRIEIYEAPL